MTYPVREHADEQDGAIEGQIDQRSGQWTRLQLMEMDAAFCLRMRRARLERQIWRGAHPLPLRRGARRPVALGKGPGRKPRAGAGGQAWEALTPTPPTPPRQQTRPRM